MTDRSTRGPVAAVSFGDGVVMEGLAFQSGARFRCRSRFRIIFGRAAEKAEIVSRLLPPVGTGLRQHALPEPDARRWERDAAGNRVERLVFTGPIGRLELVSELLHLVPDRPGPQHDDVLDPLAVHPDPGRHRDPAGRTAALYLAGTSSGDRGPVATVAALAGRLARDIREADRPSDPARPVTEILETGRGRCLDRSRVLLACLRTVAMPARLACGHLIGSPEPHAWTEVRARNGRWVGVDPTLGGWADGRHVRLATGQTPAEIALVTGRVWPAGTGQQMTCTMSAEALR